MRVLKFKINKRRSKIKKNIKIPKSMIEGRMSNNTLPNFIEPHLIKQIFVFKYDEINKILTTFDTFPKHIHGIYNSLDLKKLKPHDELKKLYRTEWFTGEESRFVGHNFLMRHVVTFDSMRKNQVLINKVGYFFQKDNKDNYKPLDGSYVWMDCIEDKKFTNFFDTLPKNILKRLTSKTEMKKALLILMQKEKKPKIYWSRRAQNYAQILGSNDRYDIIKLAKALYELKYEIFHLEKKDRYSHTSLFFSLLEDFVQRYLYNQGLKETVKGLGPIMYCLSRNPDPKIAKSNLDKLSAELDDYTKNK